MRKWTTISSVVDSLNVDVVVVVPVVPQIEYKRRLADAFDRHIESRVDEPLRRMQTMEQELDSQRRRRLQPRI